MQILNCMPQEFRAMEPSATAALVALRQSVPPGAQVTADMGSSSTPGTRWSTAPGPAQQENAGQKKRTRKQRQEANQEVNFGTVKCCFRKLCKFEALGEVVETCVAILARVRRGCFEGHATVCREITDGLARQSFFRGRKWAAGVLGMLCCELGGEL
jgi:hypothetical protein